MGNKGFDLTQAKLYNTFPSWVNLKCRKTCFATRVNASNFSPEQAEAVKLNNNGYGTKAIVKESNGDSN